MRAVDTNVVVRVLMRDDEKQALAADEYVAHSAWISHLVLAEAAWVMGAVYGRGHADLVKAIEMLLRHRDFAIQDADVVEAALAHYRRKPALRFTDCLILEIARKAGHLPLGTFDRTLGRLEDTERL